jgi:hypothetical protein
MRTRRDLVGVTRRRDASPDVQELLYPRVTGEETDRPAEKRRFALISRIIVGRTAITSSAATLSASKLSLPPSQ